MISYEIFIRDPTNDLKMKNNISIALIIENPVSNPIVPPTADNIFQKLFALSFVILLKAEVPKYILTNLNLSFHSYSKK